MTSISRPPLIGADSRTGIRRFDWLLLLSALLLLAAGLANLYSIGSHLGESLLRKQLLMAVVGLAPFGIFFWVDPGWWRRFAAGLYVTNLALLVLVLFAGSSTNGAQRWIGLKFMQFQPSELAKILTVLTLASFLIARRERLDRFSTFALSFVHVAVPAVLIAEQPHYGGAMVLLVIWLCVCVAGGVPLRFVLGAVLALIALGVGATKVPGLLHDYHLKRIEAMRDVDRQGASYQQDRAQIALGVGGLVGVGYLNGRQYIPEQENDFVFTKVGEEFGLVGSVMVLLGYGFLFFRMWLVLLFASDPFLRMIVAGVLGMLAFHTAVNLAMVLGLLPVVGLWLPFLSSGGTALWLCMASVGLVLRARANEKPLLF